jgi:hypothetical protein
MCCRVTISPSFLRDAAMSDSAAIYGSWLAVYGPWLIGGIAGLVAFFITAAIMRVALRRRDRIRLERPRRPLPGTIQPMPPEPLEPMRSPAPRRKPPHVGWLLGFLAVALMGAAVVVLSVSRVTDSLLR